MSIAKEGGYMKNLFKGIVSAALIGTMMLSAAGCVRFSVIDYDDFVDALEEEASLKKSACTKGTNRRHEGYQMTRYIEGEKGNCMFAFYELDDEDDAVEMFEKQYDNYIDNLDNDEDFSGTHKEDFDEDSATGYILIDGENEDSGATVYGGIYLKENTIVMAMAMNGKDKDVDRVKGVLGAIGYPKP